MPLAITDPAFRMQAFILHYTVYLDREYVPNVDYTVNTSNKLKRFGKNQDSPICLIIEMETSNLVDDILVQMCNLENYHFQHRSARYLDIQFYMIYAA